MVFKIICNKFSMCSTCSTCLIVFLLFLVSNATAEEFTKEEYDGLALEISRHMKLVFGDSSSFTSRYEEITSNDSEPVRVEEYFVSEINKLVIVIWGESKATVSNLNEGLYRLDDLQKVLHTNSNHQFKEF